MYVLATITYIRTYIHTFIHTYIHTYVHTYVRTYIRTCIYIQCTYILVYYCTVWWLFIDIYIYCTYLTSRRYKFDCWIQSVTIIVISTKTVIIDSYFHNRSSLLYICITLIIIMYVSLLICVGLSHIMDWPIRSLLTFCGCWSCWVMVLLDQGRLLCWRVTACFLGSLWHSAASAGAKQHT